MFEYYKALAEAIIACVQTDPEKCWSVDDLVEAIFEFSKKQGPQDNIQTLFIKIFGDFGETFVHKPRPTAVSHVLRVLRQQGFFEPIFEKSKILYRRTNKQIP